jgi:DNA-binding NtrC family response regulator
MTMAQEKILIADSRQVIRHSLAEALRGWAYIPVEAATADEALNKFDVEHPAAILLDLTLSDDSGLDVLRELTRREPDTVVILLTDNVSFGDLVLALGSGANDFIGKPVNLEELKVRIHNGFEAQPVRERADPVRRARGLKFTFDHIIGHSPAIQEVLRLARKVAKSEVSSVILQGQSGTGKDLLAMAIHHASKRADHPFVAINCAALPPNLIESELFGHEKGAFTDAKARKEGLFEQANGGTIFLDEISELDINLQAKLLRVLEAGGFRRVGGLKDVSFTASVIAASNRDLKRESDAGRFRPDLYYRLAVIQLAIPPLRERGNDVLLLAQHFMKHTECQITPGLTPEAARAFQLYDWPGNVRELRNVIERALILEDGDMISTRYLPSGFLPVEDKAASRPSKVSVVGSNATVILPLEGISLDEVEASLLKQARTQCGGNKTRAAKLLGLTRDQFRYRITRLDKSNDASRGAIRRVQLKVVASNTRR